LETITRMQQETISAHIKSLTLVDSKFDAVFRYIDARARPTDTLK
jgi:hypothetical protein